MTTDQYDVAIIGSGIAGSALAAILARHGQRVIVFEAGSHPKFAIGESMILETSETLRAMADLFDVPELAYFSSECYVPYIGTSHGVKRHFGYLYHRPGQRQDPEQSLQAVIPRQPYGHELHLYRQDSDYFLASIAVAYGATVLQETPVADVIVEPERAEIVTTAGERYAANYVVDAGGFRSPLAQKYDLRDLDLQTHSRALFTHMISVPCYHDVNLPQRDYGIPFRMSEGTLHHLFPGGWLWVIPFDNHARSTNPLCSVGLMLDPRLHPAQAELSPEEEFFAFVEQFPDVARQFQGARAVRGWVRTGRIQYSARRVVGDRYALLGHAAGFIDPLFSKGLYSSFMSTGMLAHLLLDAAQDGDYSAERFRPLEEMTLGYVRANDRLIANAYRSFAHPDLWAVYAVLWLLGAYTELVKLTAIRGEAETRHDYFAQVRNLHLVGGGFPEFDRIAEQIYALVEAVDATDEQDVVRTVAEIRRIFAGVDWMPLAYRQVLAGKNHLAANKFRLSLLGGRDSFLGSGAYRRHFFGDRSMWAIGRFFVTEKIRYAASTLALKRRFGRSQRHKPKSGRSGPKIIAKPAQNRI